MLHASERAGAVHLRRGGVVCVCVWLCACWVVVVVVVWVFLHTSKWHFSVCSWVAIDIVTAVTPVPDYAWYLTAVC